MNDSAAHAMYGLAAGMAGTAVLNATTYADMAVRNRPPSHLPDEVVQEFANMAGIGRLDEHRREGLGMLMGYADGFSTGVLFGILRPHMRAVPWYAMAAGMTIFTMALSEGTATALGKTNPATWGASKWIAGLIPRFLYGCATCLVYDLLTPE